MLDDDSNFFISSDEDKESLEGTLTIEEALNRTKDFSLREQKKLIGLLRPTAKIEKEAAFIFHNIKYDQLLELIEKLKLRYKTINNQQ